MICLWWHMRVISRTASVTLSSTSTTSVVIRLVWVYLGEIPSCLKKLYGCWFDADRSTNEKMIWNVAMVSPKQPSYCIVIEHHVHSIRSLWLVASMTVFSNSSLSPYPSLSYQLSKWMDLRDCARSQNQVCVMCTYPCVSCLYIVIGDAYE